MSLPFYSTGSACTCVVLGEECTRARAYISGALLVDLERKQRQSFSIKDAIIVRRRDS